MSSETAVLVLQGGGALGSYQAGAFEALSSAHQNVDWVAGISIGAINSALIAGNTPSTRVTALRAFWETVSSASVPSGMFDGLVPRNWLNQFSATGSTITGIPGFFRPNHPFAAFMPVGTTGAQSFYDTRPLRDTLLDLVDFDLINDGPVRLSVGAVNVETGNMTWFDSADTKIGPEHIMGSGALPPGFPAVEIDGAHYWDGGLVSNTPLQYVLDERCPFEDICVFQVDLFNARGDVPRSVWSVEAREKDIRFSSRTRFNTDMMRRVRETQAAAHRLYEKLPDDLKSDPDAAALIQNDANPNITIAHLIYRQADHELGSKDYEFSRQSMLDHWASGHQDATCTVSDPAWQAHHDAPKGIQVFDLCQ